MMIPITTVIANKMTIVFGSTIVEHLTKEHTTLSVQDHNLT